ncbi:MAG TPA: hypothetical protein VF228_18155 [Iamia sp.]
MLHRTAVVVSALALAAAVGCGGDDPDHLAAGDDFSVEAALADLPVPDGDEGLTVTVFDLEAAGEANDAGERPGSDDDDVGGWFLTATGTATEEGEDFPPVFVPPAEVLGTERIASIEEIESELGWSALDVDAVAEVLLPPFRFGVVAGDVGDDTFADAGLEADDGVVRIGEGEDGETDPAGATAARPLGTPLSMAAEDGRLAVGSSGDDVAAWLDGEPATLAEEDDLRGVAAVLDEAGAVAAYLTTATPSSGSYTAVGIGWAVEDGEPRITIAYAYEDEEAAEGAVDEVEAAYDATSAITAAPIADQLALDDVEVDGAVVVAHVRPGPEGRPQTPFAMLQQRDVPFAFG